MKDGWEVTKFGFWFSQKENLFFRGELVGRTQNRIQKVDDGKRQARCLQAGRATKFEIFDVKRIQRDVNVDDNKVVIRIARLLLKRPLLPTLALQVQSTPFT